MPLPNMKKQTKLLTWLVVVLVTICSVFAFGGKYKPIDKDFISFKIDPKKQQIALYWKDENGTNLRSIGHLKDWLYEDKKQLIFAMNAGMYKPDNSPQGLYIENHKLLSPLDTTSGAGNFYLLPNGVFYITQNNIAAITKTTKFSNTTDIKFATQSGPMLLINGHIHPAFKATSTNLNIRNGVGILPNNNVVFAMSKKEINFYDFADYFKQLGCKNALYLDGLVSRTYLPEEQWTQTDGNFGVMIGVTKALK